MSFKVGIIFLSGNIRPSVLITLGTNKKFGYGLGYTSTLGLQENDHLNFSNRKAKSIKLERTINSSISHVCVENIVISK